MPVALEASAPLDQTRSGSSLIALCRAATAERNAGRPARPPALRPAMAPGAVDRLERRIRRGDARPSTSDRGLGDAPAPPRPGCVARAAPAARLRALARIGPRARRGRAPRGRAARRSAAADLAPARSSRSSCAPAPRPRSCSPSSPRSATARGCEPPDLDDAIEAIEGASVPAWRGPADGRVRILSPYRVRGRARAVPVLRLAPGRRVPGPRRRDPLLGEERRAALGIPDLRRRDPAQEERYLFHACVSRPTDRLYLSWRSATRTDARSPARRSSTRCSTCSPRTRRPPRSS